MLIRLGYACISKTIDVTPSSPFTYTEYQKTNNLEKLDKVIISNLEALNELITYNIKNNIHFFRLSSKIIPLATLEDVKFDYHDKYQKHYDKISNNIKNSNIRVDFHPDQFCVLNSTRKEVVDNTINILKYHYNLLDYLNIKNKILILHIGSSTFGKENSLKRFINNFNKLPNYLKECIAIENDDKVFDIKDCLYLNKILNIKVVLDVHHNRCNGNYDLKDFFTEVISTWNITPKIHYSSPKNKTKKDFRSHHEYIDSEEFIDFLENIKFINKDLDIMIEAKGKDEAVFKLIRELKYKTNYKFVDDTSFII